MLKTLLFGFLIASLISALTFTHLYANYQRYGSIQPGYDRIYDIPQKQSKYYKAEGIEQEVANANFYEVAYQATLRGMKSLVGVMGHGERLYPRYPGKLLIIFLSCSGLILLCSLSYWFQSHLHPRVRLITFAFLVIPVAFYFFFMWRGFGGYKVNGYFGSQGRYAIGYLHLFLIGLAALIGHPLTRSLWIELPRKIVLVFALCGLGMVFVRPHIYALDSVEVYRKAKIPELVRTTLQEEGFEKLQIGYTFPGQLGTEGFIRKARNKLENFYELRYDFATLGGALPSISHMDEIPLVLWARGHSLQPFGISPFDGAKVEIGFADKSGKILSPPRAKQLELSSHIDIYRVSIRVPTEPKELSLYVKLLNHKPARFMHALNLWPYKRSAEVFGLFFAATEAPKETAPEEIALPQEESSHIELQESL